MIFSYKKSNLQYDLELSNSESRSIEAVQVESAHQLAGCSSREARALVQYDKARENGILPLNLVSIAGYQTLLLACVEEASIENEKYFRFLTGVEVRLLQVKKEICNQAIFLAYFGDQDNLIPLAQKLKSEDYLQSQLKEVSRLKLDLGNEGSEGVVSQFLDGLINYGVSRNASDIHISPMREGTRLCLRVDGKILNHEEELCSLEMHKQLINRIKVLSSLDISENRRPQDGSFRLTNSGLEINIRVSIFPTIHGEKAVLRLFGNLKFLPLAGLGFSQAAYELASRSLNEKHGLLLFSGPTGSGKTTSLYACLHELLASDLQIVSIEDPVEMELKGVSQSAVKNKIGNTFDMLLKSVLRQDPDVIAIGELRDSDSAKTAIQAAVTGHLILTSVHAGSIKEIFNRLSGLSVSLIDLLFATKLILNQKLIPKLCEKCKVIDLERSNVIGETVFKEVGCSECDYTGFKDRFLSAEVLVPKIEQLGTKALSKIQPNIDLLEYGYYLPHKECLDLALKKGIISLEHYYYNTASCSD